MAVPQADQQGPQRGTLTRGTSPCTQEPERPTWYGVNCLESSETSKGLAAQVPERNFRKGFIEGGKDETS